MGYQSGLLFDRIVIRHDKENRGRTNEEITRLLMNGIRRSAPGREVHVISDEVEAIAWCMEHCARGAFVVVCTEEVRPSIQFLTAEKNKETSVLSTF